MEFICIGDWSLDCGNWSLYIKWTETLNLTLATCSSEPLKLENCIFTSHPEFGKQFLNLINHITSKSKVSYHTNRHMFFFFFRFSFFAVIQKLFQSLSSWITQLQQYSDRQKAILFIFYNCIFFFQSLDMWNLVIFFFCRQLLIFNFSSWFCASSSLVHLFLASLISKEIFLNSGLVES